MRDIRIAAAQFESLDGDKLKNIGRIAELAKGAAVQGAEVVLFHECCVTGYSYLQKLRRSELLDLAEPVPDGPTVRALTSMACDLRITLLAGLLERDGDRIHNTCVAVGPSGLLARHRKIHTFISPHLTPGDQLTLFDLGGVRCGILICYDNNLPENVRVTALMGAEVIFMPHVTCGTESPMPGRGVIPREIWENRHRDPVRCRQEFRGPKGREWLLKWLPARAYENGIYAVFSNAVGVDYNTVKPGLSMILDPYGEILVESHALGEDCIHALCTSEKLSRSSGQRYLKARRPELYAKLVEPRSQGDAAVTLPGWAPERPADAR